MRCALFCNYFEVSSVAVSPHQFSCQHCYDNNEEVVGFIPVLCGVIVRRVSFLVCQGFLIILKATEEKEKKTKALIIRWHIVEAVGTNVSLHFWFLRLSSFSSGSTWMNWCRKKSECWTEQGACQQRSCETRWTTNTSHSRAALNYTCERMRANTPKQRKPLKPLKAYFHNNHSFAYKSCSRLIIYVGSFMLYCWSGRSSIKSFYLRK